MFDITSGTSYPAAKKQFTTYIRSYTGSLCLINSRTSNEVDCPLLEFELVCGNPSRSVVVHATSVSGQLSDRINYRKRFYALKLA